MFIVYSENIHRKVCLNSSQKKVHIAQKICLDTSEYVQICHKTCSETPQKMFTPLEKIVPTIPSNFLLLHRSIPSISTSCYFLSLIDGGALLFSLSECLNVQSHRTIVPIIPSSFCSAYLYAPFQMVYR